MPSCVLSPQALCHPVHPAVKRKQRVGFFSSNTLNPCTSFSFRDLGCMLSARQARFPTEGRAYLGCGSCEGAAVRGGGAGGSRTFGERLLYPELCRTGAEHVSPLTGHSRALPAPRSPRDTTTVAKSPGSGLNRSSFQVPSVGWREQISQGTELHSIPSGAREGSSLQLPCSKFPVVWHHRLRTEESG